MFEIDQYDSKLHQTRPMRAEAQYSAHEEIAEVSFLMWGEHCTECAAPACYETCDLFEPRPDSRCRRFRFGIFKNASFSSFRGYGAEIAFKKWGVLGAMGNTAMIPWSQAKWYERLAFLAARFLNAVGPLLSRITRDERWQYPAFGLSRRLSSILHRRNKGRTKPDAFLLEVYNPGADPVRMQLAMDYAPEARHGSPELVQIQPRFRTTVVFGPGYSRHDFDRRLFQSFADNGLPFNISLVPEADTAARLVFLSADFVRYKQRKTASSKPPDIKCVVWDLDNTIWDGILVEDETVGLRANVKEILQRLDQRGILCSIASKNDHEFAWRRLEELGIAEYFLVPQINWFPKSENIKTIARKLNIGLDTFAFIDDNPFELTEVGTAIPEITCIPVQNMNELLDGARFQGSKTADALSRRRYYQEAIQREEKQAEFGADYLRFLAYCDIRLEIRNYREQDFDRVAELVQRTNQLNFSGRKYDREQLRQILDNPEIDKYALHCSDRFGSYGLIGFGMARSTAQEIEVHDLMLSCRVQGKLAEQAFFDHLESQHNPDGATRVRVNFVETKRNQPARQALEAAGFQRLENSSFVREIGPVRNSSEYVKVTCEGGCRAEAAGVRG